MADHLDFIRIRGLESSGDEVFQGLGGDTSISTSSGAGGNSAGFDVLAFLESLADDYGSVSNILPRTEGPSTRGLNRGLPAVIGTTALAVFKSKQAIGLAIFEALRCLVKEIIEAAVDDLDPFSERSRLAGIENRLNDIDGHLKTALIWEDGILGIDKSILGTALMEDEASLVRIGIDDQRASLQELKAAIETLKYNDEEIVIGDLHAYLRSKIVEY